MTCSTVNCPKATDVQPHNTSGVRDEFTDQGYPTGFELTKVTAGGFNSSHFHCNCPSVDYLAETRLNHQLFQNHKCSMESKVKCRLPCENNLCKMNELSDDEREKLVDGGRRRLIFVDAFFTYL